MYEKEQTSERASKWCGVGDVAAGVVEEVEEVEREATRRSSQDHHSCLE